MAAALLGDFAALARSERNIIWQFFTDPARDRHDPDGAAQFARECVADLLDRLGVACQLSAQAGGVQDGLTSTVGACNRAERIDPEEIPSRERRGRLGAESA
jgi:MmyB-like transcription regulator ligand binding domain